MSKEQALMSALEKETIELEKSLQNTMKTAAIVGLGVAGVVLLYKILSPEKKKTKPIRSSTSGGTTSAVTASIVSVALRKLIPMAIEKLTAPTSKDHKNEPTAPSTSR